MTTMNEQDSILGNGERGSQDVMVRVAWLESMRPIVVRKSDDPTYQLAAFDTVDWMPSKNFQHYVLKLLCKISGLSEENFTESPAFQDVSHRVKMPSVAILAANHDVITDEMHLELDAALTCFSRLVLAGQDMEGQGQFFPVELSQKTVEIVIAMAADFLTIFGGKKVGEPRLLKTRSCQILVAGSYRQQADKPLPAPEKWDAIGEIDGLRGANRTVFILTVERKTLPIIFDEAVFKKPLRDRVLDGEKYQFVIEAEWIAHDRKVDTLVSFHPCSGTDRSFS